jgi:hypothetical protein
MKSCYCRLILALLVIVFAWWNVSWAPIALTVIGATLAMMALKNNTCCCCKSKEDKEK